MQILGQQKSELVVDLLHKHLFKNVFESDEIHITCLLKIQHQKKKTSKEQTNFFENLPFPSVIFKQNH